MVQILEVETGFKVGVSALYVTYSLAIMATGIWGYSTLPGKCKSVNLHNYLRYIIVCGAIMTVAYISFAICALTCRQEIEGGDGNTVLRVESFDEMPSWLLVFTLIFSVISLALFGGVLQEFSKKENKDCKGGSYDNFRKFLLIMSGFPTIVIIIMSVMLFRRYSKFREITKKEKRSEIKQKAGKLKDLKFSDKNPFKKVSSHKAIEWEAKYGNLKPKED
jgi:heme/copper-type cytochrome/quinol oxidase subunit 2